MFILNIYVTCILWERRERKEPYKPLQGAAFVLSLFPLPENCSCVALPEKDLSAWRVSRGASSELPEVRHYLRQCLARKELVCCTWTGSFLHIFCTISHCSASSKTACIPLTLIMPWHFTRFGNNKELLPSTDYLAGQMRHQKDFSTGETPAVDLANKGRFSQPKLSAKIINTQIWNLG